MQKAHEYDRHTEINFHCFIGETEAILSMLLERDPHGDGKGTHAHFHTIIMCPKLKIVDYPEPDRCQVTEKTCPFIAPLGSPKRYSKLRKFDYAHTIIQMMAFVEFYGAQLVNSLFADKGLPPPRDNPRLSELSRIMVISHLIHDEDFRKINKLRKIRNKLAHRPKAYLSFSEKELFKLSREAQELSGSIRRTVEESTK